VRWGPLAFGIAFLIIAFVVFDQGLVTASATLHGSVKAVDSANWTVTPTGVTTVQAHITWTTASGGKPVLLVITAHPTCVHPGGVLANKTGSQGSFSLSMVPGHTYELYTCNTGNNAAGTFSVSFSGEFSWNYILAIFPLVPAVLLLILAFRPRKPDLFPDI